MMSSEEEADCFGLYGDKLSKNSSPSSKRARQRVDAGEPRNSYSSIPNFSSRPSFFASGLYGAFFSQNQQQFGIFGQGFGPKMLNELLGRQVKDAATPGDAMMAVDSAAAEAAVNFECLSASTMIRRGSDEGGSPPPGDLAHHMLRDILQGRKKDLLALEQELRVANALGATEPGSPDNNNSISNNNNNNELKNGAVNNSDSRPWVLSEGSDDGASAGRPAVNGVAGNESDSGEDEPAPTPGAAAAASADEADKRRGDAEDAGDDSEPPSPAAPEPKEETDENQGKDSVKTEQIELKRARVENIVSSMRSSPSLPSQVNGCKKRKRYHPQQHDNSAAERYAAMGLNVNMNMLIDDDDDEELEPNEIRQKRVEKDALKSQLRTMQEQLAEMQQKYVQLCTRMDQESECPDNDDASSDMEQDASNLTMPDKPVVSTAVSTPVKENVTVTPATTPVSQPVMSPAVSKMPPSSRSHPHVPSHLPPQHLPIPPNFNGALSMLQQQVLQEQHGGPHGPLPPHHHLHPHAHAQMPPHHALSNAAAMYLGVSHKLYMEQEARMKEAAMAAEQQHHHQQHLNQQHHQHMMNQHHQSQQHAPLPQQQQQGSQTPHGQPPTPHQHPVGSSQSSAQTPTSIPQQRDQSQVNQSPPQPQHPKPNPEFTERLNVLRSQALAPPVSGPDLEGLADVLKTEITSSLSNLIDTIMSRFVQQRRFFGKQTEAASVAAEQLNKDLLLASQLLDRKSPRSKVVDRGNPGPPERTPSANVNGLSPQTQGPLRVNGNLFPNMTAPQQHHNGTGNNSNPENNINTMNLPHVRPSPNQALFQPPKPPTSSMGNHVTTVALYNSMSSMGGSQQGQGGPFCDSGREGAPEQNEALSLVVAPKKKRHKVTDTRITPRTVSRILAQDGIGSSPQASMDSPPKYNMIASTSSNGGDSPPPRPYHPPPPPPPPPMLPVSLPTSVAIPNPSLHESQVFSPYSPFYGPPPPGPHQPPHVPSSASPPGVADLRDSPPLHPPTLLHPALLAAAQHGSPDYASMRASSNGLGGDSIDRGSDCNSGDGPYDGITPTDSPSARVGTGAPLSGGAPLGLSYGLTYEASSLAYLQKLGYVSNNNNNNEFGSSLPKDGSLTESHSSTLTPMHLRKAKLMFFWVRYPSSAVLKMYFPDIKFNKNNTAQLVKWFSNFREFYYIQMEKYARQAVSEGVKTIEELHVSGDCEIYRVLNLHYNRNNHIEVWGDQVPQNFRYVVEQTLKEFFKAIQGGKDTEQSWKKSIYKIISRMDDPVPEYFKTPNFLEQLE